MVKVRRSRWVHGGRYKNLGGSRIQITKLKGEAAPPPPTFIATVGSRSIVGQIDDLLDLDYLVSVDAGSEAATAMTVELKRTDTSMVVASQAVTPPIAPGANQTISFTGIDSIDGLSALDFQVCVVTDIGTVLGSAEPAMRLLFDFVSTAVGAITPTITDDGAATSIFTADGGVTWDLTALPGGSTTVTAFVDALANVSDINLDSTSLDFASTPYSEIQSTNTSGFSAQSNAITGTEVASWTSDFAAAPYALIANFLNNDNQWLAASDPNWPTDIAAVRAVSGDVLIGQGTLQLVATGVGGGDKWIGTPYVFDGSVFFAPRDGDDILEYVIATGTTRLISTGETDNDRWSGGFVEVNNKLYAAPEDSDNFLEYTKATDTVRLIPQGTVGVNNKYDGGGIVVNDIIYWSPRSADDIPSYEEATDTVTLRSVTLANDSFRYRPIEVNGNLYFTPRNSADIMEYDIDTDTVRFISTTLGGGGNKYHSAVYYAPTDQIVFCPRDEDDIMIYNVTLDTVQFVATGEGGGEKWNGPGVVVGSDIYFVPVDSDNVLKLSMPGLTVTLIDTTLGGNNKFDRGFTLAPDGCLYAAPRDSDDVLKVDPTTDTITLIPTGEGGADKWDGRPAVSGSTLYFTPRDNGNILILPV